MSFFTYKGSSEVSSSTKYDFRMAGSTRHAEQPFNVVKTPRLDPSDYVPKRFGLKYDPPTIILEYLVPSSNNLYHHKMKIPNLKSTSSNAEIIEDLRRKHSVYLPVNKVSDQQIAGLLEKLKKKLPKENDEESPAIGSNLSMSKSFSVLSKKESSTLNTFSFQLSNQENDCPNVPNIRNSNLLNHNDTFKKIAPISKNPLSASIEKSTKDFWEEQRPKTAAPALLSSPNQQAVSNGQGFWDVDDEDVRDVDYSKYDLNKLSTEELAKHKKKMDEVFLQHQKKPGDPDFVYDVREEFNPKESNDWDDEL